MVALRSGCISQVALTMADAGPEAAALRADGRTSTQIRTLLCERGLLQRADGSARWSQSNCSILAAVYGPRATVSRKEDPQQAVVEVVFKPKSGYVRAGEAGQEAQYQQVIRQAVQGILLAALHPRTVVQVVLQVLSEDGSVLACALNAACAALVDAGVPLKGIFAAVSCGITGQQQLVLDPTAKEEQDAETTCCFAFAIKGDHAVADGPIVSYAMGASDIDSYLTMHDLAKAACQRIAHFTRFSLDKVFTRTHNCN